jgi:hypothetical protein
MLLVTSAFTPSWRCAVFLTITAHCVYCETDILGSVPFYAGALLAELSLSLNNNNISRSPTWNIGFYGGRLLLSPIKKYWTIVLTIFALFIASFPVEGYEKRAWSVFLSRFGDRFIRDDCIRLPSTYILMNQGNYSGYTRYSVPSCSYSVFCTRPPSGTSYPVALLYSLEAFRTRCISFNHV